MNLAQAVGTNIGVVAVDAILRDAGGEASISSDLFVDSPANYPPTTNPCTPGQAHEAVWRFTYMINGMPQTVPIYVDRVTTGPEALFASAKIQFCFQGPIGTPSGAQILFALMSVKSVFTNPADMSPRFWHAT